MSLKDTLKAKSLGLGAMVDAELARSGKDEKSSHPRTAIGQASAFQLAVAEKNGRIAELESQLAGRESRLIPTDAVGANPWQPRRLFNQDEIRRLADSIAEVGLIQPVVVRTKSVPTRDTLTTNVLPQTSVPTRDTRYELVAGERRLRAHQLLGRSEIRAVVVEATNEDLALMALAENLDREDLTDYETSKAIRRVENEFPSKKRMAEAIGIGRQDLYKYLAFSTLPDFIVADLEVDPRLLGRNAAEQLASVLKTQGSEAAELLGDYWTKVKSGELDQTKLAAMIDVAIKRGASTRTERDIRKLFVGKEQAGSITRDASALTVKIKTAALTGDKEKRLREFIQQLLVNPD